MDKKNQDVVLLSLIHKWQKEPAKYADELINAISPKLANICIKASSKHQVDQLSPSPNSIYSEVYIKLKIGLLRDLEIESVSTFYKCLTRNIAFYLLDKHRKIKAIKRNVELKNLSTCDSSALRDKSHTNKIDIDDIEKGLTKLKNIEPNLHDAMSLKILMALSVRQIADIMGKSESSVERYLKQGKKVLTALVHGVDEIQFVGSR